MQFLECSFMTDSGMYRTHTRKEPAALQSSTLWCTYMFHLQHLARKAVLPEFPPALSPQSQHGITEWLRWEGPSGSICSNPCSSRGTPWCPGPCPGGFERSPKRRSHSFWATCATAPSSTQHRITLWCSERANCFPVYAHCLLSWH